MNKALFLARASGAVGRRLVPLLVSEGWRVAACRCSRQGGGSLRQERVAGHRRGRRRGDEREGEEGTRLDGQLEVPGMTSPVLPSMFEIRPAPQTSKPA